MTTVHGEVRFKVGRNALLLGEFTIARLVRATGLNPESVRTEVQRLRKAGFVSSERMPGRRDALYRLADDPEKRLTLSRSVEAFYPAPPQPVAPRPTSRLYQAAVEALDRAEKVGGAQAEPLLEQAAQQLEGAWQAEGAGRAPELVRAHLFREQGRLACLQARREQARELLTRAKAAFIAAGLEAEARLIDEYLLYMEARRRMEISSATDAAAMARCVLEALNASVGSLIGPLARLLVDLTSSLSTSMPDRVNDAVFQSMATLGERVVREVREEIRRGFPSKSLANQGMWVDLPGRTRQSRSAVRPVSRQES